MWVFLALSSKLWIKNAQQHYYSCENSFFAPQKWHRSLRLMGLDIMPVKRFSRGKSKATHPCTPIAASYPR
jgi:hypothetical protein